MLIRDAWCIYGKVIFFNRWFEEKILLIDQEIDWFATRAIVMSPAAAMSITWMMTKWHTCTVYCTYGNRWHCICTVRSYNNFVLCAAACLPDSKQIGCASAHRAALEFWLGTTIMTVAQVFGKFSQSASLKMRPNPKPARPKLRTNERNPKSKRTTDPPFAYPCSLSQKRHLVCTQFFINIRKSGA